jgi:predicted dehydrogenase
MPPVKKALNVGVLGCGYWGPNLIRNLRSLPECRLTVVCDRDQQRLAHMRALYPGVGLTTDIKDLVADKTLDAVAIATPVAHHFAHAKALLESGKHVLVEKPITSSSRQCDDLITIAKRKKAVLMVGHTFIYSQPVRKIREIVESGDIGEIRYISSRRLNLGLFQKDINVTWDLAPHDLSIILYLMKEAPSAVNCQGKANVTPGVEDVTNMTLTFPNGGFATIHSSWLDPKKVREMTIVGSRRMIVYNDLEPLQKIAIYDVRVERPPHYDTFAEFQYSYHYGDMYVPYIKQEEPLKVQCQHFLDCIRTGATPITSAEDGSRLVKILEASTESLRNGGKRVPLAIR